MLPASPTLASAPALASPPALASAPVLASPPGDASVLASTASGRMHETTTVAVVSDAGQAPPSSGTLSRRRTVTVTSPGDDGQTKVAVSRSPVWSPSTMAPTGLDQAKVSSDASGPLAVATS